jgi:DNA cross-link repair 1B protein
MILLDGYFGRILYTGDFRFNASMMKEPILQETKIDTLYIDNTYCHPKFVFPKQSDAIINIQSLITSFPGHNVILGLDSLGKEEILVSLAQTFQTKVFIAI